MDDTLQFWPLCHLHVTLKNDYTNIVVCLLCFDFLQTNIQTTNKSILLLYINLSSTNNSDYNIMVFISCWIQKKFWKICYSWFFFEKNILAHIHYIRIINIYCYFFNYKCQFDNKTFSLNLSLLVWLSEGVLRCGSRFLLKNLNFNNKNCPNLSDYFFINKPEAKLDIIKKWRSGFCFQIQKLAPRPFASEILWPLKYMQRCFPLFFLREKSAPNHIIKEGQSQNVKVTRNWEE